MKSGRKIVLTGGGGHAKVVIDSLKAEGREVVAVIDQQSTQPLFGIQRVAAYDPADWPETDMLIAIGDNATRRKISLQSQHTFTGTIHPSAIVSPFSTVGLGCMVLHRAIVQAATTIGDHVILNTGSQADHDCVIGDFVHIAPRATLCGSVRVGEGTIIGAGAVVLPGVQIGKWATIAAGAVVRSDVPDYAVVAGVPGQVKKYNRPSA